MAPLGRRSRRGGGDRLTATHVCGRCGRAFAREAYLALHLGRDHPDSLAPDERASFEAARRDEEAWLAGFRRHVRASLHLLPLVAVYLLILLLVAVSGVPVLWGFLLLPGTMGFGALIYYLSYTKTEPTR